MFYCFILVSIIKYKHIKYVGIAAEGEAYNLDILDKRNSKRLEKIRTPT